MVDGAGSCAVLRFFVGGSSEGVNDGRSTRFLGATFQAVLSFSAKAAGADFRMNAGAAHTDGSCAGVEEPLGPACEVRGFCAGDAVTASGTGACAAWSSACLRAI